MTPADPQSCHDLNYLGLGVGDDLKPTLIWAPHPEVQISLCLQGWPWAFPSKASTGRQN